MDKDTVLAGEVLRISFEVSGGSISEFTPPEFTGFQIIAGPNVSSSFSMINGKVDQKAAYNFILRAIESGDQNIAPAKILVGDTLFETDQKQIHILENEDFELLDDFNENKPFKKKPKKKRKTYKI